MCFGEGMRVPISTLAYYTHTQTHRFELRTCLNYVFSHFMFFVHGTVILFNTCSSSSSCKSHSLSQLLCHSSCDRLFFYFFTEKRNVNTKLIAIVTVNMSSEHISKYNSWANLLGQKLIASSVKHLTMFM